jgi:hypothetical protein
MEHTSMYLVYYDEAGDDGYPRYSSPLFVLSAVYFEHLHYRDYFERMRAFRYMLQKDYGLPGRWEMHTKGFLTHNKPYNQLQLDSSQKIEIITQYCNFAATLGIKVINVTIVKPRIQRTTYNVLDNALTYSVQRIENDINSLNRPDERFMVISDQGRLASMRKTTRRLQRMNFVPSKYGTPPRRMEIAKMVEEPLPKDSKESYFVQLADMISYVVYAYSVITTKVAQLPKRLSAYVSEGQVRAWMDMAKPAFNLNACPKDPYGIMYHPGE